MLTRIWTTEFDAARRDELQRFADEISAPMFRRLPGCIGYLYAVTDSTWITQSFWASQADIEAAEASAQYRDVVGRIMEAGFLGDDQTVAVFEVTTYAAPAQ